MKPNNIIALIAVIAIAIGFSSCDSYIDIMPKGNKVPTTLADYEPLLRAEYNVNYLPCLQALYLINDKYTYASTARSTTSLQTINYMWREEYDRTEFNSSTEDMFEYGYGILSTVNTIINEVPNATEATEAEKNEVMAYAYAIRAMVLHQIVNFYANAYDPSKADTTPGIPLIYSGELYAPYHQGTVKEVYDQIISDLNKAIELDVPEKSMTIVHPSRAAVEAALARVYLSMWEYDKALTHAQAALDRKSDLYDWIELYNQNKSKVDDPDNYLNINSPMDATGVENIWFMNGSCNPNTTNVDVVISPERASRFEDGDMKFRVRWKPYQASNDYYYRGVLSGYFNWGGITTPEVFLIKAECLARAGKYPEAMDALNTVRLKRIHPDVYQPATASNEAEAIEQIRRTKENELVGSIFPFIDMKRYNAEGKYPRTLTKVFDDETYTLSPTSHMWTMVFPAGAIKRPGNGTLTQNVDK